jgi:hypothetical protein
MQLARPELVAPLVERIDRREFDRVVLVADSAAKGYYLHQAHMGQPVWDAIAANYERIAGPIEDRYLVYAPKPWPKSQAR